jgi:hypothetical protein
MADARRQELPLVTVGDADYGEHEWFVLELVTAAFT